MTYFIVSDVHGFFDPMINALDKAGFDQFNPDHIFVSLGDLLDRGSDTISCLTFVNSLPKERKILIRGNHEVLLRECLDRGFCKNHDIHNGTAITVGELCQVSARSNDEIFAAAKSNSAWLEYESQLILFYETPNYVFTHAWVPTEGDWRDTSNVLWHSAIWQNGMRLNHEGLNPTNKTVVCGHWYSAWGHYNYEDMLYDDYSPFIEKGIIAIDAMTARSGIVNCIKIED